MSRTYRRQKISKHELDVLYKWREDWWDEEELEELKRSVWRDRKCGCVTPYYGIDKRMGDKSFKQHSKRLRRALQKRELENYDNERYIFNDKRLKKLIWVYY